MIIKTNAKLHKNSNIKAVKQVIWALTEKAGLNRFNLITTLSGSSEKANSTATTEEQ